jgi:hypothetical protein
MLDYSRYLSGNLSDYLLLKVNFDGSRPEALLVWHKPTGSAMSMVDDGLYRRLVDWMVENGVPILDKLPLPTDVGGAASVDPQLLIELEQQGLLQKSQTQG